MFAAHVCTTHCVCENQELTKQSTQDYNLRGVKMYAEKNHFSYTELTSFRADDTSVFLVSVGILKFCVLSVLFLQLDV